MQTFHEDNEQKLETAASSSCCESIKHKNPNVLYYRTTINHKEHISPNKIKDNLYQALPNKQPL